jgi:hypothetical protein
MVIVMLSDPRFKRPTAFLHLHDHFCLSDMHELVSHFKRGTRVEVLPLPFASWAQAWSYTCT